jgi:hypothetical protein
VPETAADVSRVWASQKVKLGQGFSERNQGMQHGQNTSELGTNSTKQLEHDYGSSIECKQN